MNIQRENAFAAINSEREYQDNVVGNKYSQAMHTVAAEILMMEEYIQRARFMWINNAGDEAALKEIRKATALGVRCMEHHGAPLREAAQV